ncbi:protein containing Domain of unknown function DUF1731, partial [mine drainage metagenome]
NGLGGYVMPGNEMFPWIHIEDEVGIIIKSIENKSFRGTINTVGGNDTSKEFSRKLGSVLGMRGSIPIPRFMIKRMFGKAADLVTGGSAIKSSRMDELGYKIRFLDLEEAFKTLYPESK